jgi:hypothetical protein
LCLDFLSNSKLIYASENKSKKAKHIEVSQITWLNNDQVLFVDLYFDSERLVKYSISKNQYSQNAFPENVCRRGVIINQKGDSLLLRDSLSGYSLYGHSLYKNNQKISEINTLSYISELIENQDIDRFEIIQEPIAVIDNVALIQIRAVENFPKYFINYIQNKDKTNTKSVYSGEIILNDGCPLKDIGILKTAHKIEGLDIEQMERAKFIKKVYLNRNENSVFIAGTRSLFEFNLKDKEINKIIDLKGMEHYNTEVIRDINELFVTVDNPLEYKEGLTASNNLEVYDLTSKKLKYSKKNVDLFDVSEHFLVTTAMLHVALDENAEPKIEISVYYRKTGRLIYYKIFDVQGFGRLASVFPTISPDEKHILIFKCYDGKASPIIIDTSTLNQD